ncbi:MAG: DUF1318 domain-containing protein [Candidatus Hydrogenedentes bacterium]|nr:DUF1318 domain-containing protein [Candidatus Hydrogenedentota bacterium]
MSARASVAVIGIAVVCVGCVSAIRRSSVPLDEVTARRIAVAVENIVEGTAELASLPDSVGGVSVGIKPVRDAIETRQTRYKSVEYYKKMQCVGETRSGLIERRKCDACQTRKQLDLVAILVMTENDDRRAIYASIRKANRLDAVGRDRLINAFRAEHERRAHAGDWYETEDGRWLRKTGDAVK